MFTVLTSDAKFLTIDGVPDGDYTLVCTTNTAQATDKDGVPEDTYTDNTISVGLRIAGDNVTVIPWWSQILIVALAHELNPGWLLELWLAIHGGDPGPQQVRLDEAAQLMEQAATIVRELATSLPREVVGPASPG